MASSKETESSADGYLYELMLPMWLTRVRDLLVGNDIQCFSTEQYLKRFIAREPLDFPGMVKDYGPLRSKTCTLSLARAHLEKLQQKGYVREVKQGVWAPTERFK